MIKATSWIKSSVEKPITISFVDGTEWVLQDAEELLFTVDSITISTDTFNCFLPSINVFKVVQVK